MTNPETHKEITKLTATYVNGLAILITGAGIVALPIAIIRQPEIAWVFDVMAPVLTLGGIGLHFLARSFLHDLDRTRPSEPTSTE